MQPQLPEHFLSANLIVCEKILRETDGIFSVIRAVDVVQFVVPADKDPQKGRIDLSIFAQVKTAPDYMAEHSVRLYLVRPDGQRQIASDVQKVTTTGIPGTAGGFSVSGNIAIITQQTGVHFIVLTVEELDIAQAAFTLVLRRESTH